MIYTHLLTEFGYLIVFQQGQGAWTSELFAKWFPLRWMIKRVSVIWYFCSYQENDIIWSDLLSLMLMRENKLLGC